jgi:hypothetical protein
MSFKSSSLGIAISPSMASKANIDTEQTPNGSVVRTIGKEIASKCENRMAPEPP